MFAVFSKLKYHIMKVQTESESIKSEQMKSVKPFELTQLNVISWLFKHIVIIILTFHLDLYKENISSKLKMNIAKPYCHVVDEHKFTNRSSLVCLSSGHCLSI